jgi:hypothetical protein
LATEPFDDTQKGQKLANCRLFGVLIVFLDCFELKSIKEACGGYGKNFRNGKDESFV